MNTLPDPEHSTYRLGALFPLDSYQTGLTLERVRADAAKTLYNEIDYIGAHNVPLSNVLRHQSSRMPAHAHTGHYNGAALSHILIRQAAMRPMVRLHGKALELLIGLSGPAISPGRVHNKNSQGLASNIRHMHEALIPFLAAEPGIQERMAEIAAYRTDRNAFMVGAAVVVAAARLSLLARDD